jgi:hypothetical protein
MLRLCFTLCFVLTNLSNEYSVSCSFCGSCDTSLETQPFSSQPVLVLRSILTSQSSCHSAPLFLSYSFAGCCVCSSFTGAYNMPNPFTMPDFFYLQLIAGNNARGYKCLAVRELIPVQDRNLYSGIYCVFAGSTSAGCWSQPQRHCPGWAAANTFCRRGSTHISSYESRSCEPHGCDASAWSR